MGTYEDSNYVFPILNVCKNAVNKVDQSPPVIIYSLALQSSIIISNNTGPGHIEKLAKKNIIWVANDDKLSKATIPDVEHTYKILASSVKNIKVKEVIEFIEKNNLY